MQSQAYIKPERVDTSYHLPNNQPPRQPQPQTHRLYNQPPPQSHGAAQHGVNNHGMQQKCTKTTSVAKNDTDIESLPDFPSIKGVFGWTTIDDVNIPYILRSDKKFVSVRIVEMKLLSRYPNSYPDDLGKHAPLTSFFITENEAKLLNEINIQHCDGDYGKKDFTTKDLIVLLSDFIKFFDLVKKTFPDAHTARSEHQKAGWLQIKNTVTPYLSREDGKYVPLSVIKYAAGLLTNENIHSVSPTKRECESLNNACKTAGVEFTFSEANRLIKIKDLLKLNPVDIIALPSSNPLKHATYMELPTRNNSKTENKPQLSPKTQQPYRFQPNSQLDLSRLAGQGKNPAGREQTERPREQVTIPSHMNIQGVPMFDPRLAAMYRHPYTVPRYPTANPPTHGPQGLHGPMINPLSQYYLHLQGPQNHQGQGPQNQQAPDLSRSPGSSSSNNPSPRSRPPSQSRPPSGPSQPSASPLSPTQIAGRSPGYGTHAEVPMMPHPANQAPPPYPGLNLHQLQAMFQQRFPFHFPQTAPPQAHKNSVSPRQSQGSELVNSNGQPSLTTAPSVTYTNPANIPQYVKPTTQTVSQHPNVNSHPPKSDSQNSPGCPPPLILMGPTSQAGAVPKNGLIDAAQKPPHEKDNTRKANGVPGNDINLVNLTSVRPQSPPTVNNTSPGPTTPVHPQSVSVMTKQKSPYVDKIQGSWLNNKSISCLHLDSLDRQGRYCLVEAVCKLYFNGCSVNEFLFALEKVLNVPLLTCNDDEEKAFIQYYNLPVDVLKCNKMIKFDDLETFFPQLSYMFPDKNSQEFLVGQEDGSGLDSDNNNLNKLGNDGVLTQADIESSMPVALSDVGIKRSNDTLDGEMTQKKLRVEDSK